ncbi:MAG: hypothetical protein WCG63_12140 [Opitutaceae bacterium]
MPQFASVLWLFLLLASVTRAAEPARTVQPVVAKNWSLPLFTKEGYRSMTLRGSEARTYSAERIDVIDLNITTFNGDAAAKVDSILLCRELASFFPNEKVVRGESSVRLVRDDLEITGEQWTYDHAAKKVSLGRHARITFKAQLPDILK